jgi:oligopeptide/dipeptide ABC transporter ATP-binding protein
VNDVVLSVRGLSVTFPTDDGIVHAVNGMTFDVRANEVLGVVGESGCGKTVMSLAMLGLLPPSAGVEGEVRLGDQCITGLSDRDLQRIRGTRVAMVFQDALTSLDPMFTVGSQLAEAIAVGGAHDRKGTWSEVVRLLDVVGIPNPALRAGQYPHEYSGGMRQRAMIAIAIANDPELLVADEPTTALDVTIQAQVLDVLERIQERTRTAIMLITHDLGIVAGTADRVMVMYAGRVVELGSVDDVFYRSCHPYTLGLLASLPRVDRASRGVPLYRILGEPPSPLALPTGCTFHPRCQFASVPEPCATAEPLLLPAAGLHRCACHFRDQLSGVTPESLRAKAVSS